MSLKQFNNGIALLVGLVLTVCYQFERHNRQSTKPSEPIIAKQDVTQVFEQWQVKENSIHDGNSYKKYSQI